MRPALGITYMDGAKFRGLGGPEGVIVLGVDEGCNLAKAGIRPTKKTEDGVELGDVIIGLGGGPVRDEGDMFRMLEKRRVGERVDIKVWRKGREEDVKFTLQGSDEVGLNREQMAKKAPAVHTPSRGGLL